MEIIYEGLCNIHQIEMWEKSGTGAMGILQTTSGSLGLREKFVRFINKNY